MSEYGPEEIADIRRRLVEVEFLAKCDEEFLARLRSDPVTVLREKGFAEPLTQEIVRQLEGPKGEVEAEFCDPWTCIVTGCTYWTRTPA